MGRDTRGLLERYLFSLGFGIVYTQTHFVRIGCCVRLFGALSISVYVDLYIYRYILQKYVFLKKKQLIILVPILCFRKALIFLRKHLT